MSPLDVSTTTRRVSLVVATATAGRWGSGAVVVVVVVVGAVVGGAVVGGAVVGLVVVVGSSLVVVDRAVVGGPPSVARSWLSSPPARVRAGTATRTASTAAAA